MNKEYTLLTSILTYNIVCAQTMQFLHVNRYRWTGMSDDEKQQYLDKLLGYLTQCHVSKIAVY